MQDTNVLLVNFYKIKFEYIKRILFALNKTERVSGSRDRQDSLPSILNTNCLSLSIVVFHTITSFPLSTNLLLLLSVTVSISYFHSSQSFTSSSRSLLPYSSSGVGCEILRFMKKLFTVL
ncbi:hypothetical protein GmHk_06G015833 [Glycine max]|nr:hypothetical protein GmHk_06G015833 [Glycine max]KAH1245515.1 hypothetical protein GmHk_06G015833 [Glycine max]